MQWTKARRLLGRALLLVFLGAISFSTIYPVYFAFNSSFKTQQEWIHNRFSLAIPPHLDSFKEAWSRSRVPSSFVNSVICTAGGVLGAWLVCSMAAYAATKMRFRGRDTIFVLLLATMMIPMQTILYPFFVLVKDLHLLNRHHGLILTFVAFAVPMTTYQLASYFKGIPNELIDAARIDGASTLQTLFRIILPIARPSLVTIGIINFVWMWNELLIPLMVMQKPERQTLIVSLSLLRGQYGAVPTLISAGVVIGILPVVIMYLIAQEQLIKGMTVGAIKS